MVRIPEASLVNSQILWVYEAGFFYWNTKIMQYISCLSNKVKSTLINELRIDDISDEKAEDFLNNLSACGKGIPVEIGEIKPEKGRKAKTKRKPSAYNLFIGKCMKEDNIKSLGKVPARMKQCALEWKKQKSV